MKDRCNKGQSYPSEHSARIHCKNMGNRFRAYPCPEPGHGWHVTKQVGDAGGRAGRRDNFDRQKKAARRKFRNEG